MGKKVELKGLTFGRLEVLQEGGRGTYGEVLWVCRCSCGTERTVTGNHLRAGHTRSCGCSRIESITTHGLHRHPLYSVWSDIKDRCLNKDNKYYHRYGGRGISVCDVWLDSFQSFYDFCMENGWRKSLQIDRVDNDGNYEPPNCRFVPCAVNIQNSTCAKLKKSQVLEIRERGNREVYKHLAKEFGVSPITITNIVNRQTWKNI